MGKYYTEIISTPINAMRKFLFGRVEEVITPVVGHTISDTSIFIKKANALTQKKISSPIPVADTRVLDGLRTTSGVHSIDELLGRTSINLTTPASLKNTTVTNSATVATKEVTTTAKEVPSVVKPTSKMVSTLNPKVTIDEPHIRLKDGTLIGTIKINTMNNIPMCYKASEFPKSWVHIKPDGTSELKPYLYIDLIQIDQKGNGYGREALKALYEESIKQGCEGRMLCVTAWDSYGFYEKTGWKAVGIKKRAIEIVQKRIDEFTKKIAEIEADPNRQKEVAQIKEAIKEIELTLERKQKGIPGPDDLIMFDPTEENLAILCKTNKAT